VIKSILGLSLIVSAWWIDSSRLYNYPWTLYTFVRYAPGSGQEYLRDPDGFLQQELSSHKTLDECIAAFYNPIIYHQAPVESGKCVYINNTQSSVYLKKKPWHEK